MLERLLKSKSFTVSAARVILAIVAFGGVMMVGAMAPNIFSAFGRFGKEHEFEKKFSKKKVQDSASYLKRKKLVRFVKKEGNQIVITITKDGIQRVRKFIIEDLTVEKPLQWDRKWRVVIFDIPERYRSARAALRRKLVELGFLQLQKSVFIYPYPAEDEILFIANIFGVEEYVELLTVERMLHEKGLRKFFKLS
ncbi:MAG: hypothetical protein HY445_03285 [Candidatus Niyogibacteria bacterium]|nr:hypothetical protein [Candidatus Niyogibacteria bacterium]